MRRIGLVVLTTSSMFLVLMAVLLDSAALFYMSTGMIATIGACRLQAYLAVRHLRFDRVMPPAASVGEPVTVEITVWSDRKLKRPLVVVQDALPTRLAPIDRSPSLPIAPSFDQPVRTRYRFRPMRRGKYEWRRLTAYATDALGIVTMSREYETEPARLVVYPTPLPTPFIPMPKQGSGVNELESGSTRGSGLESRGIREFAEGDPLKHVHWATSARRGELMVKEFETGSGLQAAFLLQGMGKDEVSERALDVFEAMCGHASYLAEQLLRRGAKVVFPGLESGSAEGHPEARRREIDELLAEVESNRLGSLTRQFQAAVRELGEGASIYLMAAIDEPGLADALRAAARFERLALVYDVREYDRRVAVAPAATLETMAALRAAGAEVVLMPKVEFGR